MYDAGLSHYLLLATPLVDKPLFSRHLVTVQDASAQWKLSVAQ